MLISHLTNELLRARMRLARGGTVGGRELHKKEGVAESGRKLHKEGVAEGGRKFYKEGVVEMGREVA